MAIPTIVRSQSAHNSGNLAASLTVTLGAAPTAGNLLIAFCALRGTSVATPSIAGWTLLVNDAVNQNAQVAIWYRTVQAGDGAGYTFAVSPSTNQAIVLVEVTGQHATTPINAWTLTKWTTGAFAPGTPAVPSVTTTAPNCLVFGYVAASGGTTVTPDGGGTELYDVATGGTWPVMHELNYRGVAAASTPAISMAADAGSTTNVLYGSVAIAEAGAGGAARARSQVAVIG